jgi:hypothetical protein
MTSVEEDNEDSYLPELYAFPQDTYHSRPIDKFILTSETPPFMRTEK